ncbi:hypothetical protein NOVOSPHI9U_420462 [Novosphingobium sp. 9U]|nr:hypothetical protein NOVOSPHI9U_420462 [Novosphingobium sp. 9U]
MICVRRHLASSQLVRQRSTPWVANATVALRAVSGCRSLRVRQGLLLYHGHRQPQPRRPERHQVCRADGEMPKPDEMAMRAQEVTLSDLFDEEGMLKALEVTEPVIDVGNAYIARYTDLSGRDAVSGLKLGVYELSAVGRDILVTSLGGLGAQVTRFGRSGIFIPRHGSRSSLGSGTGKWLGGRVRPRCELIHRWRSRPALTVRRNRHLVAWRCARHHVRAGAEDRSDRDPGHLQLVTRVVRIVRPDSLHPHRLALRD